MHKPLELMMSVPAMLIFQKGMEHPRWKCASPTIHSNWKYCFPFIRTKKILEWNCCTTSHEPIDWPPPARSLQNIILQRKWGKWAHKLYETDDLWDCSCKRLNRCEGISVVWKHWRVKMQPFEKEQWPIVSSLGPQDTREPSWPGKDIANDIFETLQLGGALKPRSHRQQRTGIETASCAVGSLPADEVWDVWNFFSGSFRSNSKIVAHLVRPWTQRSLRQLLRLQCKKVNLFFFQNVTRNRGRGRRGGDLREIGRHCYKKIF